MNKEMLEGILDTVPILLMPTELVERGLALRNEVSAAVAKDMYYICAGIFEFKDHNKGRYIVLNSDCDDLPRKLMHEIVMFKYGHLMGNYLEKDMENITIEQSASWEISDHYWKDQELRQMVTQKVIDLHDKYGY